MDLLSRLHHRLHQPLPGLQAQERMLSRVRAMPAEIPGNARPSAVLILLFPQQDDLNLLLIQRTEDGRAHSGQIGFPGGRKEETDADMRSAALREAQEEVGIMSTEVNIIGQLTSLYIPVSNFIVYPFVAHTPAPPVYNLSMDEVARTIELPVRELLNDTLKKTVRVTSPADRTFIRDVPAYVLNDGSVIWGATAMILAELEWVLAELINNR